ncbi:MAG: hypothetical protein JRI38_01960 [Deltaproteobacteria bacterium]|nr:hypothetical protein [Deltaproteobacteria bacterium]
MNRKPKESDWKRFRSMVEDLRERYLKGKNAEMVLELTDSEKTSTEQFWDTFERMKAEKKILEDCLDGHSRSNMFLHILSMYRYGMMTKADLKGFSEELQGNIEAFFKDRR